ncbi:MAG: hypothetical protein IPN94_04720 [Sphingobacteriales bacterium]|nr:hypothetical protein [Sphingobacteriales bacterium]
MGYKLSAVNCGLIYWVCRDKARLVSTYTPISPHRHITTSQFRHITTSLLHHFTT